METKVIEESIYYRIESSRGVMSDELTERDLQFYKEKGYFTKYFWSEDGNDWLVKRYKVGKVHKFVRKTTLTEEVLA